MVIKSVIVEKHILNSMMEYVCLNVYLAERAYWGSITPVADFQIWKKKK